MNVITFYESNFSFPNWILYRSSFLIICCPGNIFILTFLSLKVINTHEALHLSQKKII